MRVGRKFLQNSRFAEFLKQMVRQDVEGFAFSEMSDQSDIPGGKWRR
jgi:hypothetical protein